MLGLFEARSEVYTVLTSMQKDIFQSCIEYGISLWTLVFCLASRQRDMILRSLNKYII